MAIEIEVEWSPELDDELSHGLEGMAWFKQSGEASGGMTLRFHDAEKAGGWARAHADRVRGVFTFQRTHGGDLKRSFLLEYIWRDEELFRRHAAVD